MDFFIVPTAELNVLFALVILGDDRRRVLHFNVTAHPTAEWTAQQLVEAFTPHIDFVAGETSAWQSFPLSNHLSTLPSRKAVDEIYFGVQE